VRLSGILALLVVVPVAVAAQRATAPPARAARVIKTIGCAADLGTGVSTKRPFCDVLIATAPDDSVSMAVPPHSGTATLLFDLHNRFAVPALSVPPVLAFARHEAQVAVIKQNGDVIGRAAVVREFRTTDDLFDQIGGGGRPGGVKAVAPGTPEPAKFTIPAGVTAVGIVGVRLKVMTRLGEQTFDSPGRPVAIVSNVRLEVK
jgi:hypothetical protein